MRIEREAIQHGFGRAGPAGSRQILGVGGQDRLDMGQHGIGGGMQGPVLGLRRQRAEDAGGNPGPPGGVMYGDPHIGDRFGVHTHQRSVSDQPEGNGSGDDYHRPARGV